MHSPENAIKGNIFMYRGGLTVSKGKIVEVSKKGEAGEKRERKGERCTASAAADRSWRCVEAQHWLKLQQRSQHPPPLPVSLPLSLAC